MKTRLPQPDLPLAASAFNLFGEEGGDPLRIMRERDAARASADEAEAYQRRMQRTLAECPGFVTCDPPRGDASSGRVVIDPAWTVPAVSWLKRRFHVNEALELRSQIDGIAVEIKPRVRSKSGVRQTIKATFHKPEQFTFHL